MLPSTSSLDDTPDAFHTLRIVEVLIWIRQHTRECAPVGVDDAFDLPRREDRKMETEQECIKIWIGRS